MLAVNLFFFTSKPITPHSATKPIAPTSGAPSGKIVKTGNLLHVVPSQLNLLNIDYYLAITFK